MIRNLIAIVGIAVCSVLGMAGAQAQSKNLLVGTWALNTAKSPSDGPQMKNNVSKIEAVDDGIHLVNEGLVGKDQIFRVEFTVMFDGKDYPWTGSIGGKPITTVDTISYQKIDDYTYRVTEKFQGQARNTQKWVVSKDGKTRSVTMTSTDAQGQERSQTLVYDKQ
jgi:hypothetical protein